MNPLFINTWYTRINKALDRARAAVGDEEQYDLHTMSVFFYVDIALRKTNLDRNEWMEQIEDHLFSERFEEAQTFIEDLKTKLA